MSEAKIELSLSESFAKHKRNLLFVSAIIILLAAASPQKVKIPGLSSPTGFEAVEGVPASLAYFFLLCALTYFFLSYWVELLAARALNLDGVATDGVGTVNDRIVVSVGPVGQRYGRLFMLVDEISAHLSGSADRLKEIEFADRVSNRMDKIESINSVLEKFPMDRDISIASDMQSFRDQVIIVREDVRELRNSINHFNSTITDVNVKFSEFAKSYEGAEDHLKNTIDSLNGKLNRISRNISRSQRFGFAALEQVVPIGLALCALLISVDGAFMRSTGIDWLRGKVPAIEQLQAEQDAMPKVGTKSTENR